MMASENDAMTQHPSNEHSLAELPHRDHLIAVAYRLVGSRTESEDVLQDAWLRWREVDAEQVENIPAFLTAMVSRLCIDRLRHRQRELSAYKGPWLPEPVPTEEPDKQVDVLQSVHMALLVALEQLNPLERGVFILKEAFDYAHGDIAELLGITTDYSRQLLRRARGAIDGDKVTSQDEQVQPLVNAFMEAVIAGNQETLTKLLSDDVVAYSDGGGKASAALIPVEGRERVIQVISHLMNKSAGKLTFSWQRVNQQTGLCIYEDGQIHSVSTFQVKNGQICRYFTMRNPDKLQAFKTK